MRRQFAIGLRIGNTRNGSPNRINVRRSCDGCVFVHGNNGCSTILHDEGEKVVEMFLVLG